MYFLELRILLYLLIIERFLSLKWNWSQYIHRCRSNLGLLTHWITYSSVRKMLLCPIWSFSPCSGLSLVCFCLLGSTYKIADTSHPLAFSGHSDYMQLFLYLYTYMYMFSKQERPEMDDLKEKKKKLRVKGKKFWRYWGKCIERKPLQKLQKIFLHILFFSEHSNILIY